MLTPPQCIFLVILIFISPSPVIPPLYYPHYSSSVMLSLHSLLYSASLLLLSAIFVLFCLLFQSSFPFSPPLSLSRYLFSIPTSLVYLSSHPLLCPPPTFLFLFFLHPSLPLSLVSFALLSLSLSLQTSQQTDARVDKT